MKNTKLAIAGALVAGTVGAIEAKQVSADGTLSEEYTANEATETAQEKAKASEETKLDALKKSQSDAEAAKKSDNETKEAAKKAELDQEQASLSEKQAADLKSLDDQQASEKATAEADAKTTNEAKEAEANAAIKAKEEANKTAVADKEAELSNDPAQNADTKRSEAKSEQESADQSAQATYTAEEAAAASTREAAKSAAESELQSATATAQSAKDARDSAAQAESSQAVTAAEEAKKAADKTAADIDAKVTSGETNSNVPRTAKSGDTKGGYTNTWPEYMFVHNTAELPTEINDPYTSEEARYGSEIILSYENNGTDSSEHIEDGNITEAQFNELNEYALLLLNNYRKSQGLSELINVTDTKAFSDFITKYRNDNGISFVHTSQYDPETGKKSTDSNKDKAKFFEFEAVANQSGLAQEGENLGMLPQTTAAGYWTMTEMKTAIYDVIAAMIYEDMASNNGHKDNFENPDAKYVAISISDLPWKDNVADFADMYQGKNYAITFNMLSDATGQSAKTKTAAPASTAVAKIQAARDAYGVSQELLDQQAAAHAEAAAKATALETAKQTAQATLNQKLSDSQATLESDVSAAKTTRDNKVAAADSAYTTAEQVAATKLANAKAANQTNYDNAVSAFHDETAEERDARHAAVLNALKTQLDAELQEVKTEQNAALAQFKEATASKLTAAEAARQAARAALVNAQAEEAANLPAKLNAELEAYKNQLAAEYEALVASNKVVFGKAQAASMTYLDSLEDKGTHVEYTYNEETGVFDGKVKDDAKPAYNPETGELTNVSTDGVPSAEAVLTSNDTSVVSSKSESATDANAASTTSTLPKTAKRAEKHAVSAAGLIGLSVAGFVATMTFCRKR